MAAQTRPTIAAEPRTRVRKKSELRWLRKNGYIPAIVFGHGDSQNIRVSAREIGDFLREHTAGGILDLKLDGDTTPVLIREMDRDGVSGKVIHLGFQRVDLRETIRTTIPITFVGEETLLQDDLVLERQTAELEVHARADRLPEAISIDVTGMEAGHTIRIGELQLPEGVQPTKDPDTVVANITVPTVPADVAAALDAEEVAHAAVAEGDAAYGEAGEAGEETDQEPAVGTAQEPGD